MNIHLVLVSVLLALRVKVSSQGNDVQASSGSKLRVHKRSATTATAVTMTTMSISTLPNSTPPTRNTTDTTEADPGTTGASGQDGTTTSTITSVSHTSGPTGPDPAGSTEGRRSGCQCDAEGFSAGDIAAAVVVSFLAGVAVLGIPLLTCWARQHKRLCFRARTLARSPSKQPTIHFTPPNNTRHDVGSDSTRPVQTQKNDTEKQKYEHLVIAPKETTQPEQSPQQEHVYSKLTPQHPDLYESARDSEVSTHDIFVLQNDNFRNTFDGQQCST